MVHRSRMILCLRVRVHSLLVWRIALCLLSRCRRCWALSPPVPPLSGCCGRKPPRVGRRSQLWGIGEIINGCNFRLGATGTNPHVPATTCFCGRHIQGSDIDHAIRCNRLSGSRSRWHNHWQEALSHISARTGCFSRTELSYTSVSVAAADRRGARAYLKKEKAEPASVIRSSRQ
jgi:hypothetical protein